MKEYLITLRREHRGAMQDDWRRAIRRMEGVEVVSEDERFQVLRVNASDTAIETIRREFGDWVHVQEPLKGEAPD